MSGYFFWISVQFQNNYSTNIGQYLAYSSCFWLLSTGKRTGEQSIGDHRGPQPPLFHQAELLRFCPKNEPFIQSMKSYESPQLCLCLLAVFTGHLFLGRVNTVKRLTWTPGRRPRRRWRGRAPGGWRCVPARRGSARASPSRRPRWWCWRRPACRSARLRPCPGCSRRAAPGSARGSSTAGDSAAPSSPGNSVVMRHRGLKTKTVREERGQTEHADRAGKYQKGRQRDSGLSCFTSHEYSCLSFETWTTDTTEMFVRGKPEGNRTRPSETPPGQQFNRGG